MTAGCKRKADLPEKVETVLRLLISADLAVKARCSMES